MDFSQRLSISHYKTIAAVNEAHDVYLVQHQENQKICLKKVLSVYNLHIYEYLLSHPITGIPKVYAIYEENDQLTVIEEFISGISLQEIITAQTLSVDLIIRFMCELCDILGKLHFLNPPIIHRDIKPSNIIITPHNHVVLIDFNAAKYMNSKSDSDTMLLGTKGYAAPEQYGFGSSTPQTDIYALGILLKELSSALPASTSLFDSIISKCTQMNPSDRIENVHMLRLEFERLKGQHKTDSQFTRAGVWKNIAFPGFRTKTPWKVLIASVTYLFIFWICLSLEVQDSTIIQLWIERIISLFIMLSIVFCCFNYCNIQRFMPLCKKNHRIIRYIGILLLNIELIFSLFLIMTLLVTVF